MAASSISVAVRIRPLTPRETSLLRPTLKDTPFIGDTGSLLSAASSSSSTTSSASLHLGSRSSGFVQRVVQALDDRVLIFDPASSSPVASFQKSILGPGIKKTKDLRFCFDRVFGEAATQHDVFDGAASSLVPGVLDGYNATAFAYGATGCGKTHTISGSTSEPGIVFLLMKDLFDRIQAKKDEIICDVTISYLEIYNENIRDLLIPNGAANLGLRENEGRVVVPGLTEQSPESAEQVIEMILAANVNRTVSATDANAVSSRSHAVLCVNVRQKARTASITEDYTTATLSIIDLAGSERASATKNKGERLLEGANINRSLLALGNCINALCDPRRSASHVPYRDSKLTRLLKHSLGGNCRTLMIVCVSPSSHHYDESFNTLQYANRAKEIKTKVTRNVLTVDRHVSQYVKVIYELRQELEARKKAEKDRFARESSLSLTAQQKLFAEVQDAIYKVQAVYKEALPRIAKLGSLLSKRDILHSTQQALSLWLTDISAYMETKAIDMAIVDDAEGLVTAWTHERSSLDGEIRQTEDARSVLQAIVSSVSRQLGDRRLLSTATSSIEAAYVKEFDCEICLGDVRLDLEIARNAAAATTAAAPTMRLLFDTIATIRQRVADQVFAGDAAPSRSDVEVFLTAFARADSQLHAVRTITASAQEAAMVPVTSSSSLLVPLKRSADAQYIQRSTTVKHTRASLASLAPSQGSKGRSPRKRAPLAISTLPSMRQRLKPQLGMRRRSLAATYGKTSELQVRKSVAWKDDAGDALVEHQSDTSSQNVGADTVILDKSSDTTMEHQTISDGVLLRSTGVETCSKQTEAHDMSNDASASCGDDSSVECNDTVSVSRSDRRLAPLAHNVPRSSLLAPKLPLTPRRMAAASARSRLSHIGPIRSAKFSRRMSALDSAATNTILEVEEGCVQSESTVARKAGRSMAAFAERINTHSSGVAFSTVGLQKASGIAARIAAARARRESSTSALPLSASTSMSSGNMDISLDLTHAAGRLPAWR